MINFELHRQAIKFAQNKGESNDLEIYEKLLKIDPTDAHI